jgi:hypothetical protein
MFFLRLFTKRRSQHNAPYQFAEMNVLGKTGLEELLLFGGELTDGVDLLDTVGLFGDKKLA